MTEDTFSKEEKAQQGWASFTKLQNLKHHLEGAETQVGNEEVTYTTTHVPGVKRKIRKQ